MAGTPSYSLWVNEELMAAALSARMKHDLEPSLHFGEIVRHYANEVRGPYVSPLIVQGSAAAFGTERSIPVANGSAAIMLFGHFIDAQRREVEKGLLARLESEKQ